MRALPFQRSYVACLGVSGMHGYYAFGALAMLLISVWLWLRNRLSRRLLAVDHLIETAQGLQSVFRAALNQPIESSAAFAPLPRDPRVLVTRTGLLVYYTVTPCDGQYAHHLSLSAKGGYLPRFAGETLVLYLAGLLGVPQDRLALSVSPTTVHHAEFVLDAAEQLQMARRAINPPPLEKLSALRKALARARPTLNWEHLEIGSRSNSSSH
jgi:hypothetical protein